MQALCVSNGLNGIFCKYTKILLAFNLNRVHNSLNMPTKPMLFSNNTLKLRGLFNACYIFIAKTSSFSESADFSFNKVIPAPQMLLKGRRYGYVH